jgi:hypothetical protein
VRLKLAPAGIELGDLLERGEIDFLMRASIEALLQYSHEHELTLRRLKIEDPSAPGTLRDTPLSEGQQA